MCQEIEFEVFCRPKFIVGKSPNIFVVKICKKKKKKAVGKRATAYYGGLPKAFDVIAL